MSKYKYSLNKSYWDAERREGLLDSPEAFISITMQNKNYYGQPIKDFFKIPEIQKAVDEGRWQAIFEAWDTGKLDDKILPSGEYTDWSCDILAAFLTLSGIEFMSQLEDEWVDYNLEEWSLDSN